MMALIGPQLTGGTSCSFVLVSLWGGGGQGGVRQGLRETAAGDDTVKNIPVTHTPTQTHTFISADLAEATF